MPYLNGTFAINPPNGLKQHCLDWGLEAPEVPLTSLWETCEFSSLTNSAKAFLVGWAHRVIFTEAKTQAGQEIQYLLSKIMTSLTPQLCVPLTPA